MSWGLRLTGTARDRAGLLAVLAQAPATLTADWLFLHSQSVAVGTDGERPGGAGDGFDVVAGPDATVGYALCDVLRQEDALALARLGHDVVSVVPAIGEAGELSPGRLELIAVRDGARRGLDGLLPRRAAGLLAALPPARRQSAPLPAEAVFVVDDPAVTALLLERVLLLQRPDATVGTLAFSDVDHAAAGRDDDDDKGRRARVIVRVPAPPAWLVWKHAEDGGGVRCFVRDDDGRGTLFVEYGWVHPLGDRLAEALAARGEIALLTGDGRLLRTKAPWPHRPIHDALRAELPATTTALLAAPGTERFPVRLRLGAALPEGSPGPEGSGGDEPREPELFLLDESDVPRLQEVVETASPEELQRLLLTRVADASGQVRFVVREAVRAGGGRLGARLQTVLGQRGFVRVVGHDGLYVPPGRRLLPPLRREDLRTLLGLEDAAAVLVDEDSDGLHLFRVVALDDEPIASLVRWQATSRRVELDRLLEEAVLAFPGVVLERPREEARVRLRDALVDVVTRTKTRRPPIPAPAAASLAVARPTAVQIDEDALRTRAQALETRLLEAAGTDDGAAWAELAQVKGALADHADAALCASTALFLGDRTALPTLVAAANRVPGDLHELVALDEPGHPAALRLCALLLDALKERDEPAPPGRGVLDDGIARRAAEQVAREGFPVARRLQWAVLRALFAPSGDVIGLTRSRERVLGALNARGLTEVFDLPRFVRAALDQRAGDVAVARRDGSHPASEQLALLERWADEQADRSDNQLVRAVVAHGIGRLRGDARALWADIERRSVAAERGPVLLLVRLYASRLQFAVDGATAGAAAAWQAEVERVLSSTERAEERRAAEWLVKRSAWLRPQDRREPPLGLRPALARVVQDAVERPAHVDLVAATEAVVAISGCFDYEVVGAVGRLLELALAGGRDDVITGVARVAATAAPGIRIAAHRAQLLGGVVRAAATTGAVELVEQAFDAVAKIVAGREVPSTRDLMGAVRPALFALRRLGEGDAARRFLDAFLPLTTKTTAGRATAPLAAALAEGYLQLGDHEAARASLDVALARIGAEETSHVDRFDAGVAVGDALRHWPTRDRFELVAALFANLAVFGDTFTVSGWFRTHQVLMAERLVDCVVDEQTARSDRVQAWLDADEARLRRRILADARTATAR